MSPKEYTNNKKTIGIRTHEGGLTYSSKKSDNKIIIEDEKKGVSKYLREGIFRKRIFELYDNLKGVRPIEDIVEEGAYRACKDIVVNRVLEIKGREASVDPEKISKLARKSFPYKDIPREAGRARNFFTGSLCDLVSNLAMIAVDRKKGG